MSWLRNLSITLKLALSSLLTLGLLGAIVWSMLSAMTRLEGAEQRMRAASAASDQLRQSWLSVRGMAVAGRELMFQQTQDSVEQTSARAAQEGKRAADALSDVLAAAADPATRTLVGQARAILLGYVGAVRQVADERNRLLEDRDNGFTLAQSRFDGTVGSTTRDLALEDLMPSEMEEALMHVRMYQAAIGDMRDATYRFLAGGDPAMQARVAAADEAAEAHAAALLKTRISQDMRETIEDMALAGKKMREFARRVFDAAAGLTETSHAADQVGAAVDTFLGAGTRAFADRVDALAEAAAAERALARRNLLVLGLAVAAVLLVSGIVTSRVVAAPIVRMTAVVQAMADGDTSRPAGFAGRRDEVGRMAAALEVLRMAVKRAFVQSQMIEQIPLGVMTARAEGDFPIAYVNPEIKRLLAPLEAVTGIAADGLMGRSIDAFHGGAARVREIIADPERLPLRTRVALGPEVFDLAVSALRSADGSYAGPMVTWTQVTRQVRLSERFEQSVGGIAGAVGEAAQSLAGVAASMRTAAEGTGARVERVASASRGAAENVQSVAASAEELARSVQEISQQVTSSARIAAQAVQEAEATDRSVAGLSEAAQRIGDVVKLIGDIAGRTNLLALNATIEAARAGDAGKGFAVVAGEVKLLANQTAKATEEIAAQITAMQSAAGTAAMALRSIGGTIQQMNEIAAGIAGAVEEQGAATQEIARAVQQAAAGSGEVDLNIGEVAAAVQQTGGEAAEMVGAAGRMTEQSTVLAREVADFLQALQQAA